jgi:hypothetical protein
MRTLRLKVADDRVLDNVKEKVTMYYTTYFMSRDSAIGIATGYGLDGRGVGV